MKRRIQVLAVLFCAFGFFGAMACDSGAEGGKAESVQAEAGGEAAKVADKGAAKDNGEADEAPAKEGEAPAKDGEGDAEDEEAAKEDEAAGGDELAQAEEGGEGKDGVAEGDGEAGAAEGDGEQADEGEEAPAKEADEEAAKEAEGDADGEEAAKEDEGADTASANAGEAEEAAEPGAQDGEVALDKPDRKANFGTFRGTVRGDDARGTITLSIRFGRVSGNMKGSRGGEAWGAGFSGAAGGTRFMASGKNKETDLKLTGAVLGKRATGSITGTINGKPTTLTFTTVQ